MSWVITVSFGVLIFLAIVGMLGLPGVFDGLLIAIILPAAVFRSMPEEKRKP